MRILKRAVFAALIVTLITVGTVHAQEGEHYTVGIIRSSEVAVQPAYDGFLERMEELGYLEDETVTYIHLDSLPQELDDETIEDARAALNGVSVDLFLVGTDWEAQVLSQLVDSDTSIVVCISQDLVSLGLVETLNEPGGNVTGIQNADYHARGLQLLVEIDPTIEQVFFPYALEGRESLAILDTLQDLAGILEIELVAVGVNNVVEAIEAIQTMSAEIDAIYLPSDPTIIQPQVMLSLIPVSRRIQAGVALPAAVPVPGVLMGYGPDPFSNGQQAALMVDRILHGADPAAMPVENADYFLMVNLQTAQNLGLEVPRTVLRQATTIIRPGDSPGLDLTGDETTEETEEGA